MCRVQAKIMAQVFKLMLPVILGFLCPLFANSELVPSFLEEPESLVVQESDLVVLNCKVKPSTATIKWIHEDQVLDNSYYAIFVYSNTLQIRSFNSSRHKGLYYCAAEVPSGSIVSRPAVLSSPFLDDFEVKPDSTVRSSVGNTVVIPCHPPNSKPQPNVSFLFKGQKITGDDRRQIMPSGNLYISSVWSGDEGEYRCIVTNSAAGRSLTAPYTTQLVLSVDSSLSKPQFVRVSSTNVSAKLGGDVMLECAVQGNPPPKTHWSRYGMMMSVNRTQNILGNLLIKKVDLIDEGTYICHLSDQGLERVFTLNIPVPPVVHITKPNMEAYEGQSVTFNCQVRSKPRHQSPNVLWFHNAKQLQSKGSDASTLRIDSVQLSDSGLYQCMTISSVGVASAVARLQVKEMDKAAGDSVIKPNIEDKSEKKKSSSKKKGKRRRRKKNKGRRNKAKGRKRGKAGRLGKKDQVHLEPPSRPDVSKVDDTSVMLNWTVPDNDGLKITVFKVQYKEFKPNKAGWSTLDEDIPSETRRFHVQKLTPGYTYKFRISAIYTNKDNRAGPNSKRFTMAKGNLKAPQRPSIKAVEPYKVDDVYSLNIIWQYVSEDSIPIDGFYLEYAVYKVNLTDKDYEQIPLLQPTARRYLIKDLLPSTEYTVRIKCFNKAGESEYSVSAVKMTNGKDPIGHPVWPIRLVTPSKQKENRPNTTTTPMIMTQTPVVKEPSPADVYHPRNSTESSSETLYMVLGIVLGIMMLTLVVFMVMCGIKQRQQRRLMMDSMGKKYMNGGFALNGINGGVVHGVQTHTDQQPQHKMNISVNHLSETLAQRGCYTAQTDLPGSPTASDNNFNSIRNGNKNVSRSIGCDETNTQGSYNQVDGCDPRSSMSASSDGQSSTGSLPDYRQCMGGGSDRTCCSCSQPRMTNSSSSITNDHRPSSAASSNASNHHHQPHQKRRCKHRRDHRTRDQATNTDLSSNDGTMDGSSLPEINNMENTETKEPELPETQLQKLESSNYSQTISSENLSEDVASASEYVLKDT